MAAITSPVFSTISRGSSGLPVACAGHTLVHRPHIVQASVSSNCFHVKSSTTAAPNVSSDVSVRLGIAFIAPFGRSRSLQVHVQRRGEHVPQHRDRQHREEHDERHHVERPDDLVPAIEGVERPAVEQRDSTGSRRSSTSRTTGWSIAAMRNASAKKPDTPITRKVPRMAAYSGLVLIRMRYGRCT